MKITKYFDKTKKKVGKFLSRRKHRSFKLTRKRDYREIINIPGNIKFTKKVFKILWKNKNIFLLLIAAYAIATLLIVGIASQDTYNTFRSVLDETSGSLLTGFWGETGKAGLMLATAITGGLSTDLSDVQQVYSGIILLLTWLVTIWILRNILAGKKIKLRDGLYNSGAPILPTFMVFLLVLVQLLPLALAIIGYVAASATGLLDSGIEAMLFWLVAFLLATLSVYWLTSTLFAAVIVTLPGMYPMKAIKAAGDLVHGRRLAVLLKLLWGGLITLLIWAVIMIPSIMIESWLKGGISTLENIPVIPILLLILMSFTVVWIPSYVYMLYREVVDNDSGVS